MKPVLEFSCAGPAVSRNSSLQNYSGVQKIISGGQDGVDLGALKAAKLLNIPTGGTAPRSFRTAHGSDPTLKSLYNLAEHPSPSYPARTKQNIADSDGTLILASNLNSRGTALTLNECIEQNKPYYVIVLKANKGGTILLIRDEVLHWLAEHAISILNVAGNHEQPKYHEEATVLILNEILSRQTRITPSPSPSYCSWTLQVQLQ